jgi:hypothetical protein
MLDVHKLSKNRKKYIKYNNLIGKNVKNFILSDAAAS